MRVAGLFLPMCTVIGTLTINASANITVSGEVTDTVGHPVEGAHIKFTSESDTSKHYSDVTDADGMYHIMLAILTVVEGESVSPIPETFQLFPNYPNPFNPSTTIPYQLGVTGHVRLVVYNVLGQPIRTLVDQPQPAGLHTVQWNGSDDQGDGVAAGLYVIRMETAQFLQSKKAVLLDGMGGIGVFRGPPSPKLAAPSRDRVDLYTVTITGDDIEPFSHVGIQVGTTLDFQVVRIAVDGPVPRAVEFSGTVTNIVTGIPVGGATVTIGSASATTSSDGTYTLSVTSSGAPSFSASAPGYYTRESAVSMTGATTINPEIIPRGDGFDLAFFDYSFRDGPIGTTRWLTQPTFEIWTQMFRCVEPCALGNPLWEATAEVVPAYFETHAREAIALAADLTGGAMANPVIATMSHPIGTRVNGVGRVNGSGAVSNSVRFMYATELESSESGGSTSITPGPFGTAITGGHLRFNRSHTSPSRDNSIYIHELAHGLGFLPGHRGGVSATPGPSIMGPDPRIVTAKDRLHAEILYKRPIGSVSPDRDPAGAVIN